MKQLAALALLLLAFGCATGYQSLDEGITGGYTETRLAPDEWRLLVEGNGLTERRQVEQILLRRAAELTLEQGKRYFVLDEHRAWVRARRDGYRAPADQAIVTALFEREPRAFDAIDIVNQTNEIARGRLSPAAQATLQRLTS